MAYLWISLLLLTFVSCDEYHDGAAEPQMAPQTAAFTMAAPRPLEKEIKRDWMQLGADELKAALEQKRNMGVAKNIILFIGDGMGVSTVSAARVFNMHVKGKRFEDAPMTWERFPNVGLSKTYNTDRYTADSAGTATAFLTGNKAPYGTIGVNQDAVRGNCSSVKGREVRSFLKHADKEGKWTGIVTTTRVTHATPSAGYAHSPERNWEARSPDAACKDIARQLVEDNAHLRVILGGARMAFLPANSSDPEYPDMSISPTSNSVRNDDIDLTQLWLNEKRTNKSLAEDKYKYVQNLTQFNAVDATKVDYLLGLFQPFHMQYEADRLNDTWKEPSLAEMTKKAIQILKRGNKGFSLLVEGGRIDHAHHDNKAYKSLYDVLALSDAVQAAVNETSSDDTLIIVSADHSHVFTLGGYPAWDNHIMGFPHASKPNGADDKKPFTILGYANGPGWAVNNKNKPTNDTPTVTVKDRMVLTEEETKDVNHVQDATIPIYSETHGGEDVGIYASGPMAHLIHGAHEQSYIAHVLMYASCVGHNKQHCQGGTKIPPDCPTPAPPTGNAVKLTMTSSTVFLLLAVVKLAL